jgi:hypothetical protein
MEKTSMFYTYLWLRENHTPYYVGKGNANRGFTSRGHRVHAPSDLSRIIVLYFNNEQEAFYKEIELIRKFGRKDNGTGCLSNLTDGGEGVTGQLALLERNAKCKGIPLSAEHRAKMSAAKVGKPPNNGGHRTAKPFRQDNTSGFKGVTFRKDTSKWQAQICINKKYKSLGSFKEITDAAAAYKNAALAHFGEL